MRSDMRGRGVDGPVGIDTPGGARGGHRAGVLDGPPAAQTGNGKNGPRIGRTAPGAATRVLREVFDFEG